MGQKTKSQCTPEEWAAHLIKCKEYRLKNIDTWRARRREYSKRPEVKEKRRKRDNQPDRVIKRRLYGQSEQGKAVKAKRFQEMRKNPDLHAKHLSVQRQRRTGFTHELFHSMLLTQNNSCAICKRTFGTGGLRPCADHCHDSGKARGILCHNCNTAEGIIRKTGMTPEQFGKVLMHYLSPLNNP